MSLHSADNIATASASWIPFDACVGAPQISSDDKNQCFCVGDVAAFWCVPLDSCRLQLEKNSYSNARCFKAMISDGCNKIMNDQRVVKRDTGIECYSQRWDFMHSSCTRYLNRVALLDRYKDGSNCVLLLVVLLNSAEEIMWLMGLDVCCLDWL